MNPGLLLAVVVAAGAVWVAVLWHSNRYAGWIAGALAGFRPSVAEVVFDYLYRMAYYGVGVLVGLDLEPVGQLIVLAAVCVVWSAPSPRDVYRRLDAHRSAR